MGLLAMLRKMKSTDQEARILVLGLDNAGKTTILKKLSDEDPSDISPTQGFNIKTITHSGFKINVWDIGGQKAIREYWNHYFKDTDVLIYVVDSADSVRIEESGMELNKLLRSKGLETCSLLVYANKQDLMSALDEGEVSKAMGLDQINDREYHIQSCSAKSGDGLFEGMETCMDWIAKMRKQKVADDSASK